MAQDAAPQYNQIFERLVVQEPEDSVERLVGKLAYAEYKLEKYEWSLESGEDIPDTDLQAFLRLYNPRVLQKHRRAAENLLLAYAGEYSDSVLEDELEEGIAGKLSLEVQESAAELTKELKQSTALLNTDLTNSVKTSQSALSSQVVALKSTWWTPVRQSLTASVIFTVILFVLAVGTRLLAPESNIGRIIQYIASQDDHELILTNPKEKLEWEKFKAISGED